MKGLHMEDLGSYIEFPLEKGKELFKDIPEGNIIRLNTCRAAVYHSVRCLGDNKVWIAKYQCDVVRDFLLRKGVEVLYYEIDEAFNPKLERNEDDTAIVLTNYFGVLGDKHFKPLIGKYQNVIIDNAQAFFTPPMDGCINCYSPRKFVATPDGAYVIGENVNRFDYPQDLSSQNSAFLFMRYEYGCNNLGYQYKKENDKRIDESDVLLMSPLTHALLDSFDYSSIYDKRKENYLYAKQLFDKLNRLDTSTLFETECAPMGYPLWTNYEIIPEFHKKHIYQARFWEWLIDDTSDKSHSLENNFAKYIALLCTDQRYGKKEIDMQFQIVQEVRNRR